MYEIGVVLSSTRKEAGIAQCVTMAAMMWVLWLNVNQRYFKNRGRNVKYLLSSFLLSRFGINDTCPRTARTTRDYAMDDGFGDDIVEWGWYMSIENPLLVLISQSVLQIFW